MLPVQLSMGTLLPRSLRSQPGGPTAGQEAVLGDTVKPGKGFFSKKARDSKQKLGMLLPCFHGYPPTWQDQIPLFLCPRSSQPKGELKTNQQNRSVRWV